MPGGSDDASFMSTAMSDGVASTSPHRGLRRVLTRYQVPVFVVLSMLLSWMFIPVADGGLLPHGPMLAALLVLALVGGRRKVADLFRQLTRWRVSWAWYVFASVSSWRCTGWPSSSPPRWEWRCRRADRR